MVAVESDNTRPVTWCVLEEVASGSRAIGGQALCTADVKALAAGHAMAAG